MFELYFGRSSSLGEAKAEAKVAELFARKVGWHCDTDVVEELVRADEAVLFNTARTQVRQAKAAKHTSSQSARQASKQAGGHKIGRRADREDRRADTSRQAGTGRQVGRARARDSSQNGVQKRKNGNRPCRYQTV